MKAHEWMKLDKEVRLELIKKYGLIRTGFTDVRGNQVISDGYTDEDLKKVEFIKDEEVIKTLENEKQESKQVEGTAISGDGVKEKSGKAKRGNQK